MSYYLSQKLSVLSMISIIGVLIIHSYYHEAAAFPAATFIQDLVGGQIVRFCIPMFFLISGYLFFFNINSGCFGSLWEKLRKRAYSLMLPYFIWNTLFFLVIVILQLIPWTSKFVNSDFLGVLKLDIGSIVTCLFWEPAAFHLWFLKYLILFMLSTPLLLLSMSNKYSAWIFALCVYAALGVFCFFDSYAQNYLFFVAGAYLAFYKIDICKKMHSVTVLVVTGTYVAWSLMNVLFPTLSSPQCDVFRLTLGCISLWGVYDWVFQIAPKLASHLLKWCSYTFFVYLFHEPWINVYKKLTLRLWGVSEISLMASYVLIPFIMFVTCVVIAKFIYRILPKTYSTLTGGRI